MEPEHAKAPLRGQPILVCGKGGSDNSTFVAVSAAVLRHRGYAVMVLDGNASNPEGRVWLLFGLGVEGEPVNLIDIKAAAWWYGHVG